MTKGISPKAWLPPLAGVLAGAVLVLIGMDVEGKTLIGAAVPYFILAYRANPGNVKSVVGLASDNLLSADAAKRLGTELDPEVKKRGR